MIVFAHNLEEAREKAGKHMITAVRINEGADVLAGLVLDGKPIGPAIFSDYAASFLRSEIAAAELEDTGEEVDPRGFFRYDPLPPLLAHDYSADPLERVSTSGNIAVFSFKGEEEADLNRRFYLPITATATPDEVADFFGEIAELEIADEEQKEADEGEKKGPFLLGASEFREYVAGRFFSLCLNAFCMFRAPGAGRTRGPLLGVFADVRARLQI